MVEELWLDSLVDVRRFPKYSAAKYRNTLTGVFRAARNLTRLIVATPKFDVAWLDSLAEDVPICPHLTTIALYAPPTSYCQNISKLLHARASVGQRLAHLNVYVDRDASTGPEGGWQKLAADELCSLVGECRIIEVNVGKNERYPSLPLPPSALSPRCAGGLWDMPDWSWLCNPLRKM